jgi:hypothetical protein
VKYSSDIQGARTIVNITTISSSGHTLSENDYLLSVTYSGACTITLPAGQAVEGRLVTINDALGTCGSGSVVLQPDGGKTIDGDSQFELNVNWRSIGVYSSAGEWFTIY